MRVEKVSGVEWQGRKITTAMIVEDGPLTDESVVFIPTFHLLHLAKTAPLNTLLATASDLKRFFEALAAAGKQWDEVTDDEMSGYLETTLSNHYELSEKSITRHRCSIAGMYAHLSESGITDKYFDYSFRYYNPHGIEQHTGLPANENFRLRKKYINKFLFENLLEHVPGTAGFIRDRNELTLQLGIQLGLRSFEVTNEQNLRIADLKKMLNFTKQAKKLSASITIFGKRRKYRKVNIPPELVNKISQFIGRYESSSLGGNLITAKNGSLLRASFACRTFKTARNMALPKLKETLARLHHDENAPYTISWKSIQALTFHCLRHTYSTNLVTYCYENNIDPNSYLPTQLGHTKPSTTKQYTDFEAALYNRDVNRRNFSVGVDDSA